MKVAVRHIKPRHSRAMHRLFLRALHEEMPYLSGQELTTIAQQNSPAKFAKATLRPTRLILGVFEGRQLVGYLIADYAQPADASIFWLYVAPEYRNNGYGSALLKKGLLKLADAGTVHVYADAWESWPFYKQFGFDHFSPDYVVRNLVQTA